MKRNKLNRKKEKMYSLKRNRAPGNVMMPLSPVLREIKSLKKNLVPKGIQGVETPGQDFTQLSFQLTKRN